MLTTTYFQACNLLEGLIPHNEGKGTATASHLENLFIFSLMWSIGALFELEDRAKMETFLLQHPSKLHYPNIQNDETIFEYVVNSEGKIWQIFVEPY